MSIIQTWKTNIKAQEALTKQFSEPFDIKFIQADSSGLGKFEIRRFNPLLSIFPKLESTFPGIQKENVFLDKGYFLHDAGVPVGNTERLQEFAEANYFEFSPKPCFSGEVILNSSPFEWVQNITGQYPNESGELLATLDEIKILDEVLRNTPRFQREKLLGAVFKVSPSENYILTQRDKALNYLKDELKLSNISTTGYYQNIVLQDVFLKEAAIEHLKEVSAYHRSHHRIVFKIDNEAFEAFEKNRESRNIFYSSEDENNDKRGVILPTPEGNEFSVSFSGGISLSDLRFEIFHFRKTFERYFHPSDIQTKHLHILHQESSVFFEHLYDLLPQDQFNISRSSDTVAFDFQDKEELDKGIKKLDNAKIADIDFHFDDHKFKVTIQHESALVDLQQELAAIPSVSSEISSDQRKLIFYCSFPNQELQHILQNRLRDILQAAMPEGASFRFHELTNGYLKYHLSFKESEYLKDLQKKLDYLNGEEISIVNDNRNEPIGTIAKVNLPYLNVFFENFSEFSHPNDDWLTVTCELRGERDKIKRLADTVDIIFSERRPDIPNAKLTSILVNSSEATTPDGDILRSQNYLNTKEAVASNLLSNNINEKQLEAVCKSLLANDLFMIQGPPGTGKSTAISEIIWQHIRKSREENEDQMRVLVTSETNLAVDNALEKLRSNRHMLIKPIRFGSEDKLDKEGRQFSLEYLTKWVNNELFLDENDEVQDNILDSWIRQVKNRSAEAESPDNQHVLKRWQKILSQKENLIRSTFYKNYVANANVIGATCSSIGKTNSIGKFTSFFRNYCQVVYPSAYESFRASPGRSKASALESKKIEFDLVVQDEASKASPPELALPCLYGKKSIIIGDHRQLPPMVDTNEFLENLNNLRRKSKVPADKREISSLIQYISENRNSFEKSHFETLFFGLHENLRTSFDTQYRMHPGINETVKQFYAEDGGLQCGISEEDANSSDLSNPMSRYHGVTKTPKTHVVWIETKSPEIRKGTSRFNPGEVQMIDWLLNQIYQNPGYSDFIDFWPEDALDEKQVGIITFYGAQTGELNKLRYKYPDMPLRISPVDRFQGMERNIIIVSLVRSNCIANFPNQPPNYEDFPELGYAKQTSLGFAEFPNRLNVALSRAKRLLVIVGNSDHFRTNPQYDSVYKTIENSTYGRIMNANAVK